MKFSSKIIAFAAIPTLLFVMGLAISISSLVHTQTEFDRYISTEQAVERGLGDLYAQGLQMGQALRNVVLDPKNPKALENLKAAGAPEARIRQGAAAKSATEGREILLKLELGKAGG